MDPLDRHGDASHAQVTAGAYSEFLAWCRDQGVEATPAQAFGRRLTAMGFASGRTGRARLRRGIGLIPREDGKR